jgi:SAM-dependent methyltransferase
MPAYAHLSNVGARNAKLELQASGERIDSLVAALPLAGSKRILEVGCGTGALTREIARQWPDAVEVVGLDLSGSHVNFATAASAGASITTTRFVQGDGRRPAAEFIGRFDVVLARYVLMYAMADGSAVDLLSGMIRCLRPGGILLLIEADINFGSHMNPPPVEPLASIMRDVVRYYRERGGIEWRAGIRLYELLSEMRLDGVDVSLLNCRIIQGGCPRALVEHDGQDIETLIAPVVAGHFRESAAIELADQWRRLLSNTRGFTYTPIFMASWTKPSRGSSMPAKEEAFEC